jgi:hypothetical protein
MSRFLVQLLLAAVCLLAACGAEIDLAAKALPLESIAGNKMILDDSKKMGTLADVQRPYKLIHYCYPGNYMHFVWKRCFPCEPTNYADDFNPTDHCTPCPAGTTSGEGATVCYPCPAGTVYNAGWRRCE